MAVLERFIKNKARYFVLLAIINLWSAISLATQKNGNSQLLHLKSDTFLYNNETRLGIYKGHIRLTQGTRLLMADYATTYSNKYGQIIKIIATGKPARYYAFMLPKQTKLVASGNIIYYYPLRDWLEAVGDAEIIHNQNYIKGPKINYDFIKKTIVSPTSKKGHTHILIAPLNQTTNL